jgi:lantibiotic biosynthesis protein
MNRVKNNYLIVKLKEITNSLAKLSDIAYNSNNLLGDKSGVALFMFYMYKLTERDDYYCKAIELLEEVIGIHESYEIIPTAVSKYGWLMNHLNKLDFIEADVDEYFENINQELFKFMQNSLQKDNYDFLHGSLGIALYFLTNENHTNKQYLGEFVKDFHKIALCDNNGRLKWISVLDFDSNKKGYNISMSHGLASIIAVFSKIYLKGIEIDVTGSIVEGAVSYLLNQKLPLAGADL